MDLSAFIKRAEDLAELGKRVASTAGSTPYGGDFIDDAMFGEFRAAALSFIRNVYGESHPHFRDFSTRVNSGVKVQVDVGVGIMRAIWGELEGGWTQTTLGLVSAQIFSSFIEMAEHLLDEGYKDAATVMIGSVLEQHLKQLADKHGLVTTFVDGRGRTVPKRADTLNSDLAKAGLYNLLDQKQVTAWLDLRNKAAHGDYGAYKIEQVRLMNQGVVNFITRVPI